MQRAARYPMLSLRPSPARALSLAILSLAAASAWAISAAQYSSARPAAYAKAERLREALEGRPEQQRTRLQYDHVLDAYRAIYHSDPGSPKADASIAAVADLLAEEGRVFQDDKALRDACNRAVNPFGDGQSSPRIVGILRDIPIDDSLLDKQTIY